MKYVVALLCGLLAAAVGLALVVCLLVFSSAPTVGDSPALTPEDLASVRSLLRQAMLRDQPKGNLEQLTLRAREIEQAMNYLLDARLNGNARVTITDGVAVLAVSVPVHASVFGSWVNAEVALVKADDLLLHVQHLQVGALPIPASMANALMLQLHAQLLQEEPEYARVASVITGFTIDSDQLTVSYRWQRELLDQLAARGRNLMLDPDHQTRLAAHIKQLTQLAASLPDKISVTALLAPMFTFAQARGGSAVEENRAALQTLAMYALEVDPVLLLGASAGVSMPQKHDLRLLSRHDFALHLLISAGVEVSTDGNMAAEIGQLKEQLDTKAGGTGFSFTDIAIDRTGARLGELAVANEAAAKRVQQVLAEPTLQESVFTPSLQGLPEFMSETDFAKRFNTTGSPAYNTVLADIEARISRLTLFAPNP